jgi:YVTN family beta-propeller protein
VRAGVRSAEHRPRVTLALAGLVLLSGAVGFLTLVAAPTPATPLGHLSLGGPRAGPISPHLSPFSARPLEGNHTRAALLPTPRAGPGTVPPNVSISVALFNRSTFQGLANVVPNDAPGAIAVDPVSLRLYVADQNSSEVSIINLTSNEVIGTLQFPTGGPISSLAIDNLSQELYGVDSTYGYVDALNLTGNHSTAAELKVGSPQAVAYDSGTGEVLVSSASPDQLLVFNGTNHTLLSSYSTPGSPDGIAVDPSAGVAFVASSSSDSVSRIALSNGSVRNISVGVGPTGVAFDPVNNSFFVSNSGSDNVSVVNLTTLGVRSVPVGSAPSAILYDGPADEVYVANSGGSNLSLLNASNPSRATSLTVGSFPSYLACDRKANQLFVSETSTYNITVLNTSIENVSAEITVGATPLLVSWLAEEGQLLVSDASAQWGYALNATNGAAAPIPVAGMGAVSSVTVPALGRLFVASTLEDRIWAISLENASVVDSVSLPHGPASLAYDPGSGRLFATDPVDSTVEAFDAATLRETGTVHFPTPGQNVSLSGLAVELPTQQLFVAERAAGKVAIVNATTLQFVTNLSVPSPTAVTFAAEFNRIVVASGSNLVFFAGATHLLITTLHLDTPIGSLTSSPSTGDLYVGSLSNNSMEVVEANPALPRGNITLLSLPGSPALDGASGLLWIPQPSLGELVGVPTSGTDPVWIQNLSAGPSSVPVGIEMNFTTSVSGGVHPYRYLYSGLPPGCATLNRTRLACSPDRAGNYTVRLEVKDATGNSTNATVFLNVSAKPVVVLGGFTASPTGIDLGASADLRVYASTNYGNLSYSYSGLPSGCAGANSSTLRCTPNVTGNFTIHVSVEGGLGSRANDSLNLSVFSDPFLASFRASLDALDAGQTTILTSQPRGGSPPFALEYTGLPTGCVSMNSTNLSCRPSGSGNFTVILSATDAVGGRTNATLTLVVTPATVIGSFEATPGAVDVDESVSFLTQASGGAKFLSFAYAGLPPGCAELNLSELTCNPSLPGNYSVTVSVHDALAPAINRSLLLKVAPRPSISSFRASPVDSEVGGFITLRVGASGGTGFLAYSYTQLPAGCGVPDTAVVSCQVNAPGAFTSVVTVTDSAQTSALASVSYQVFPVGTVHPSILSFASSSSGTRVGQTIVLTVTVANSTAPFRYTFGGLPGGCTSQNTSVLPCTPSASGSFTVTVSVKSPYGGVANGSLNLTILAASPTTSSSAPRSSGLPLFTIAVGVAIALFAILLLILFQQRRRDRTPPDEALPAVPSAPPPPPAVADPEPPPAPAAPAAPEVVPTPTVSPSDSLMELEAELENLSKELREQPASEDAPPESPSGPQ